MVSLPTGPLYSAKLRIARGFSASHFPYFWSLQAFARLNDDFWRFVSASKISVPGDRG
jgi:hypothetical protein